MCLKNWLGATLAIALLTNVAAAADAVASGKIKSINADNKTFILTDSENKDFTFKIGENLVANRDGKESKSDLKAGDPISVCYDKGVITWTAHYILIHEGTGKNNELIRGSVKAYDPVKKELTFTNQLKVDSNYVMGKAMVRVNMEETKIEDIKIGDHALLIVNTVNGKSTLQSVMVDRAK